MLRSMYSGISGMKNFQTKLDVIGNNIANVNTFGFKKGRVMFKDMFSQSMGGASAPTTTRGGTNAKQVGLGSSLAAIDTVHTGGSLQTTGRTLDLAIEGDGYFQVQDGTNKYYTRAGNFYLDNSGNIVNADGLYLLDKSGAKMTIELNSSDISIGPDGKVSYIDSTGVLKTINNAIGIAKFNNNEGLKKVGNNLYTNTTNSGTASMEDPGTKGAGVIRSASLEMSNVDLSEEFTEMIVAQRGFQANTKIITTSDEILQELVNLKR